MSTEIKDGKYMWICTKCKIRAKGDEITTPMGVEPTKGEGDTADCHHPGWVKSPKTIDFTIDGIPLPRTYKVLEESMNRGQEKPNPYFDPDDKSEKPPMHLCPVSLPEAVATVFGSGAHDRPDYDWLQEPRPYTRYMDSLERHINSFKDGITNDSATGMHHLWHAAACLSILIEYEKRGVTTNDIHEHDN